MAYRVNPMIEFKNLSGEGKNIIITHFKKYPQKEALYEIISHGDCDLLERYIDEIGFTQENLRQSEKSIQLKQLIFYAFHELSIKRVPICQNIKKRILGKLVKLNYFTSSYSCSHSEDKPKLESFKRMKKEICQSIRELLEIKSVADQGNTFLFICSYLACKINSAKKLFKLLSQTKSLEASIFKLGIPWEQIQFILCIFVYSYEHIEVDGVPLYLSVLTRNTLVEHLKPFLYQLESFEIKEIFTVSQNSLEEQRQKSKSKIISPINIPDENAKINANSSFKHKILDKGNDEGVVMPQDKMEIMYQNLFRDFWLIKNVYSMKIINEHIDLALKIDYEPDSNIPFLALERCLLVIGEFMKCSSESPHISEDLKSIISCLTTRDLQDCIKKIRNNLSHLPDTKFGDTQLQPSLPKSFFNKIQLDLMKIRDTFRLLWTKEKFKVVCRFAESLKSCKTIDDIYRLYPDFIMDSVITELSKFKSKFNTVSLLHVKQELENIMLLDDLKDTEDAAFIQELLILINNNENIPLNSSDKLLFLILSLGHHLRYLSVIKNKCVESALYKCLLDTILDNLLSFQGNYNEILSLLGDGLYRLMLKSKNPKVKYLSLTLFHYIAVSMKETSGISYFNENIKKEHIQEKSFVETEYEIKKILNCLEDSLTSKEAKEKFHNKVSTEIDLYMRISKLFSIVQELMKNGTKIKDFKTKINDAVILIGNQNSDLDSEMLCALKNNEFKECLKCIKSKYTGNRKCKYEALVRAFSRNSELQSKIKLVTDFLKKINLNKLDSTYCMSVSIENNIVMGYLSALRGTFNDMKKIQFMGLQPNLDEAYQPKLFAATEMLLLQTLEVAHSFGGADSKISLLSLRPDVLLHCGKSLRNYLAHYDIIYKILPYDPDVIISCLASELSCYGVEWLLNQNFLVRRELVDFDWFTEGECYGSHSRRLLALQDAMFVAIANDDLKGLKECIDSGCDPRGINLNGINAIQFAFQQSSCHCFTYLVERCNVIVISSSKFEFSKCCLCLDISSPSEFIKLINLCLQQYSGDTIQTSENIVDKVFKVVDYVNEKYVTYKSCYRKPLVDYLHCVICFGDVEDVRKFCEVGIAELSAPDINGDYPIHWAAAIGSLSICKSLLNGGITVNKPDSRGYSPLDIAIAEHQWETVVYLMEHGALKYHYVDPVILAIMTNQSTWIDKLLKISPFLVGEKHIDLFLISYAFCCCNPELAEKLLCWLKDVIENVVNDCTDDTSTTFDSANLTSFIYWFILCCACYIGKTDIVNLIWSHNYNNFNNFTMISHLCKSDSSLPLKFTYNNSKGILEVVNFFSKNSLLHLACQNGGTIKTEVITYLIEKDFKIDDRNQSGLVPLHIALLNKNTEICEVLIENGADVNLLTPTGFAPIHIASMYGLTDILKHLLDRKVALTVRTQDTLRSPLHLASYGGHDLALQMLIESNKECISAGNESILDWGDTNGNTALHLATSQGNLKSVEILLKNGANTLSMNNADQTIVYQAVCSRRADVLSLIIKYIPNEQKTLIINTLAEVSSKKVELFEIVKITSVNLEPLLDAWQSSIKFKVTAPTFMACNNEIIKLLLKSGADVNLSNDLKQTALHYAAADGRLDVVQALISWPGCLIDIIDQYGNTPLGNAVNFNHPDVVDILLQNGANVQLCSSRLLIFGSRHEETEEVKMFFESLSNDNKLFWETHFGDDYELQGSTLLLSVLAFLGRNDMIKIFIDNGTEIDRSTWNNPLVYALQNNQTEVAITLLETYSLQEISCPSLPYLHLAIKKNNLKFVEVLLMKGVSPNFVDDHGLGALHLSAHLGHIDCLKSLVQCGANINARSRFRFLTALHYAVLSDHINVVKFLIVNSANVNCHGSTLQTPLSLAVNLGNIELVNVLINGGARKEHVGLVGESIVYDALIGGSLDMIRLLIKSQTVSTDTLRQSDNESSTNNKLPTLKCSSNLHRSFSLDNLIIKEPFMKSDHSANGHSKSHYSFSYPFANIEGDNLTTSISRSKSYYDISIFHRDMKFNDKFPLHLLAITGNTDLAELLISYGYDVNQETSKGFTPLHVAVACDSCEFVSLLLQNCARADVLDNTLSSPLHRAIRKGNQDIIQLLKNHLYLLKKTETRTERGMNKN